MIGRLVRAVVVAALVGLGCLLLGIVLTALRIPPATAIGAFLERFDWVLGVLAGLWYFFGGSL